MKLTIQMQMGSNEQAVIEVPLRDILDWDQKVAPALARLEQRVGDRGRRIMAGSKQLKEMAAENPEHANIVHNLVMLCLGAMPTVGEQGLVEVPIDVPTLVREPAEAA